LIGFEVPFALAGLGLVLVPIALHALARRVPPVHFLPTARFLDPSPRRRGRVSWPRDVLLLACRTLAVAALALAAGHPFVRAATLPRPEEPPLVLVLDDTLSMAHGKPRSRLDRAREKLLGELDRLAPGAPVALLTTTRPRAPFEDRSHVRERLSSLSATPRSGSLLAALESAGELARGRAGTRVLVASDFDRAAVRDLEHRSAAARELSIECVFVGDDERRNAWLSSVELHPDVPTAGFPLEVRARVSSVGLDPLAPVTVSLEVGGEPVRIERVRAGELARFRIPQAKPGDLEGELRVSVPGDALALDDRVPVAALVRELLPVTVAGPVPDPVARALDAVSRAQGAAISVSVRAPQDLVRSLETARVLFLVAPRDLDALAVEAIAGFVEKGGGLVVWAGDDVPAAALRALADRGTLPARARVERDGEALPPLPDEESFEPELARGLGALALAPQAVLEPAPGATVVLRDSRGAPLWVERGRTAILGFSPCGRNASLEGETVFPILVRRVLATGLGTWSSHEVAAGEAVERTELARLAGVAPGELALARLVTPAGAERPLGDAFVPETPGVYRILSHQGAELALVPVRPSERESALEGSTPQAREALARSVSPAVRPADEAHEDATASFAGAGLALLLLASLVSNRPREP
jgi:hypothetical protein